MSEHAHEFTPAVAPDYICTCGAVGRRKKGVIVVIKSSVAPRFHQRGILDITRLGNLGDSAYHASSKWGQRHVSYQRDEEGL